MELAILGAGPAGLAAATAALEKGTSFVVFEIGKPLIARERTSPEDLVCGVGGAGLFSDGKFSFAPSATGLWALQPDSMLREAYAWMAARLSENGIDPPPFATDGGRAEMIAQMLKPYPSSYMPLERRMELIGSLEGQIGERMCTGVEAEVREGEGQLLLEAGGEEIEAAAVVLASGRFAPAANLDETSRRFRRVEIGMRVEQDADRFALDAELVSGLLDPKWVRRSADGRLEWRTFCCCRQGEVVETRFGDLTTVSGRADGPPTGRSNFGLNVRFEDREEAITALDRALAGARGAPLTVAAADIAASRSSNPIAERFGEMIATALAEGLDALGCDLERDFSEATLRLPAIEGVGYYPDVDQSLRVSPAIWAAGDAAGMFRGLVPALVSGRLAGSAACETIARG